MPVASVFAATVIVSNYFYAHTNSAGTFYFKDKYGTDNQYGDNLQKDAIIEGVLVSAQGMAAGDKITLTTGTGASFDVTPGVLLTLNVARSDYIKIAIVKTGANEVYARLEELHTLDDSDSGTSVTYTYSVNEIPTTYGSLGPGTAPADVAGNYYYFPPRDAYKYDYTPPTGVSHYELHYTSPGGTPYMRDFQQAPTGTHYLTCNGTYEMQFFNAAGSMVGKSPQMTTTEITNPTCNSQPEGAAGYSDFAVRKTATGYEWDAVPGATSYDVYKDGQIVGTATGTTADVTGDGAVTIIAKDATGSMIGQADYTPAATPPPPPPPTDTGCDGCQTIKDMLACPEWDQYMGEWGKVIRDNVPPAPDWDDVATKFRDKIVPAMADELQSREKPVSPPPPLPSFDPAPQLPKLQDIPAPLPFDMNSNVPSFEPDYTGSEPFTIPDPSSITYSDTDKGYGYADPAAPLPSHDYTKKPQPDIPGPSYTPAEPPPTGTPSPTYQPPPSDGTPPDYNSGTPGTAPDYQTPPPAPDNTHEFYEMIP